MTAGRDLLFKLLLLLESAVEAGLSLHYARSLAVGEKVLMNSADGEFTVSPDITVAFGYT